MAIEGERPRCRLKFRGVLGPEVGAASESEPRVDGWEHTFSDALLLPGSPRAARGRTRLTRRVSRFGPARSIVVKVVFPFAHASVGERCGWGIGVRLGAWRSVEWGKYDDVIRQLRISCSPHVPASYPSDSSVLGSCPKLANSFSGRRHSAQIRTTLVDVGHFLGPRLAICPAIVGRSLANLPSRK